MFIIVARVVSVIAVILYLRLLPIEVHAVIFYAMAMSHYSLGLFYSGRPMKSLLAGPRGSISLLLLLGISCLLVIFRFPQATVYFGLHWALTDAYLSRQRMESKGVFFPEFFYFMRFLGYFSIHIVLFSHYFASRYYVSQSMLFTLSFVGAAISFSAAYLSALKNFTRQSKEILWFDFIGMLIAAAVFYAYSKQIIGRDTVMYHGFLWLFIPLEGTQSARQFFQKGNFLIWHLVLFIIFLFATPFVFTVFGFQMTSDHYMDQINNVGYFHITTSLLLSTLNPKPLLKAGGASFAFVPQGAS